MLRRVTPVLLVLLIVLVAASAALAQEPEEDAAPAVWDFLFSWHYMLFVVFAVIGLVLVMNRLVNRWIRLAVMAAVFVLFGLDYFFPLHPSPMCGVTNLFMFKVTTGIFFPIFLALLTAMLLPSFVGSKLFCGWVCPLGALQELANKIPFKWKIKQFNFTAFNAVRLSLLGLFILTVFAVKTHIAFLAERLEADPTQGPWVPFSAYSVYQPINFFELLHWSIDLTFYIMMALLLIASLVLYRPFCYSICPIGALTWLIEKIAPGRVRIDRQACTECMECVDASPCPTIKLIVDGKSRALPDCTSCGECIKACRYDALSYGFIAKRSTPPASKPTTGA